MRHLGVLFDLRDAQLFLYGEGVEEVAAEDERVLRGVDGVDPAWGDEEGVAGFDDDAAAFLHFVAEENVRLAAGQRPLFIFLKQNVREKCSVADPNFFYSGSGSKNLSTLTQKKWLSSRKYDPACSSWIQDQIRIRIFYLSRIPDPGVKKAPDSDTLEKCSYKSKI